MHSAENPRKVPNSMQGLTVSETYDLITAVHDGLMKGEILGPGGRRIEDFWFSLRALQNRLVDQCSWQECAAMYARIRPLLERAYAKAKDGDILDLSFVEPLCQALNGNGQEQRKDKIDEGLVRDNGDDEPSRDEEVTFLKLGLLLCDASIRHHGSGSKQLLGTSAFAEDNAAASRFLESQFGVLVRGRDGMFTNDGETVADLKIALLARLEQLGVGELELAQFGDELSDENANIGDEEAGLNLEILQHSLALCDESIGKFGGDSNQLLRGKEQKSLTKDQFSVVMRFLRDEFSVSVIRGSGAVVKDGETLAGLRKALLENVESSNAPPMILVEQQGTHGGNLELLQGALRWCEESIKVNGGYSDLLLSKKQWPGIIRLAPILKSRYGVETACAGLRKGTRTQAGTTLTDLKEELLADIANPDRPMSQMARMHEEQRELPLLEGALGWCEASIKVNGVDSDLLLTQRQWPETYKFATILKARFGVEAVNGLRRGTLTQAGTTLTDLRKDLLAQIADPSRPIVRKVPKIVPKIMPTALLEAKRELLLLEGALGWCEESIKANGADSDLLLGEKQWRDKYAPILKSRYGVETAFGGLRRGTRTQSGTTLADLRIDLLAQIADPSRPKVPKIMTVPIAILEAQKKLLLLEGALRWCEASIKANGEDSDLLLTWRRWPETTKFAPILKTRFGVETSKGGLRRGTRTRSGTALADLQRDLLAAIADANRLISQSDRIESSESGKRLNIDDDDDDDEGDDPLMQLGREGFVEASDSAERQKLLAMGFKSDAIQKAVATNDSPDEVLECLLNMDNDEMDDNEKPVRAKRARPSDDEGND